MDFYEKLDRQTARFRKQYPKEMPERLEWWRKFLGLNRGHILQLLGMSAEEARKARKKPLKDILKEPKYRDNAFLVHEGFLMLLTLYQPDPPVLVEALRNAQFISEPEPLDVLAERVLQGGSHFVPNLTAYLATAMNGKPGKEES